RFGGLKSSLVSPTSPCATASLRNELPVACTSASTLSTTRLRQYRYDRKRCVVKGQSVPLRSKNAMARQISSPPMYLPANRAMLAETDSSAHPDSASSKRSGFSSTRCCDIISRRKIFERTEKVWGSLSESIQCVLRTRSVRRHERDRFGSEPYQRAKRFRTRYLTFGNRL